MLLVVTVLVVLAFAIGLGVRLAVPPGPHDAPLGADADGGITVSSESANESANSPEPVSLTIYTDYSSPDAATFLTVNDLLMRGLLDSGTATISIHPVALPELSGGDGDYAVRAANAAACVAEYTTASFWEFHVALFANQPTGPERSATDDDLVELAEGSGVDRMSEVDACIRNGTFEPWVEDRSAEVTGHGSLVVDRLPVVLADGRAYAGSISSNTEFRAFLASAVPDG